MTSFGVSEVPDSPRQGAALFHAEGLNVDFITDAGRLRVVEGVDLQVREREVTALVGESGSGKTVTAKAIMRLLPEPPARISGGPMLFDGANLLALDGRAMRQVRGRDVSMVFQEPGSALNPVLTVGRQVVGAVLHHHRGSRNAGRARAVELLESVRLPDPARVFGAYPHELSGGMQQRVMIALALAGRPRLLIADEPTAALDVTVQAQILRLLRELRNELGMSMLLITHDLGVVNELADRVVVMYSGRIVEEGSRADILGAPRHPYARSLVSPESPDVRLSGTESRTAVPEAGRPGCRFAPRCGRATAVCSNVDPKPVRLSAHHRAWCHAVEREESR